MMEFIKYVFVLEENYWYVFSGIVACFCYFSYRDWRDSKLGHVDITTNGGIQKDSGETDQDDPNREERGYDHDSALGDDLQHVPFRPHEYSDPVMIRKSKDFYDTMSRRRTVRFFRDEKIPNEVIQNIIRTAGTSPSGAHTEPWTFVTIRDSHVKQAVRDIVEEEEQVNYERRMSKQWTADLRPLKTTWSKPYLTDAPILLLVFRQTHSTREDGATKNHYYSEISVAIAAGILLAAIQVSGLVTLTSTPLNCGPRLRTLLSRPSNEKLMLLFPIGKAAHDCTVPDLKRKEYEEIFCEI